MWEQYGAVESTWCLRKDAKQLVKQVRRSVPRAFARSVLVVIFVATQFTPGALAELKATRQALKIHDLLQAEKADTANMTQDNRSFGGVSVLF